MSSSILLSALTMTFTANAASTSMLFDVGTDDQHPNYITANLANNGTDGEYVLKGQRLSVYPGTPFNFVGNTTAPTEIFFNLEGSLYGAQIPQIGNHGPYAAPVLGLLGHHGDAGWTKTGNQVTHTQTGASQGFYACKDTVAGEDYTVLSWGIDGPKEELPEGCKPTKVIIQSTSSC